MTPLADDDLELAHRLADEARTLSLAHFRGAFEQRRKADGSIVTEVDEAIERTIRARLADERPGDAMLGEEFGETGSGPRRWIVDAIDGTASFAAGRRGWGTLIALEIDGEVSVGVCDQTGIGRRYFAARGQGAWRRDAGGAEQRLAVSSRRTLSGARAFAPSCEWTPDAAAKAGAEALREMTEQSGSDDHPALLVASGELDVAAFFMGGPWDIAAPSIVVTEAGGRFSDLDGGTSIARTGGLFSNALVHAAALAIVGR